MTVALMAAISRAEGDELDAEAYERQLPPEFVKPLFKTPDEKDKEDRSGEIPRHSAVAIRSRILPIGWPNEPSELDGTLREAVKANDLKLVQSLLSHGVDIRKKDYRGDTPLHLAAWTGFEAMAELLISKGAGMEEKDGWGDTSLHLAVKRDCKSIVRLLISKGADKETRNKTGDRPLHSAVRFRDEAMVRLLLRAWANPEAWGATDTPLHLVVFLNWVEGARVLLDEGANIEALNSVGMTPLHQSADGLRYRDTPLRRSVNGLWDGDTLVVYRRDAVARLLLSRGANRTAKDKQGRTAYDIAKTWKPAVANLFR